MAKLVMIGKGDMEQEVRDMAKTNNLNIEIVSWLPQEQLKDYYSKAKYMVFPSMHDSSGNVVLEALSWQLPVITLDSGGPATVLGENLSQLTVQTRGRTVEEVEKAMLNLMCRLSADEIFYGNVQKLAYQRSQELTWDKTVNKVYSIIRLQ